MKKWTATCPGHDANTACEDDPFGSCAACDEAEDERLCGLCGMRRATPPNTACSTCAG